MCNKIPWCVHTSWLVMCVGDLRNVYFYLYKHRAPWIIMAATYDSAKRLFTKGNIWILTGFYLYLWGDMNMWSQISQCFHIQISSSWNHPSCKTMTRLPHTASAMATDDVVRLIHKTTTSIWFMLKHLQANFTNTQIDGCRQAWS